MGTPQSWSTVIDHSTNAAYNTWGQEMETKILAAGATQSADTGQITWGARTRAGTNANDGYQIFYMTGSLHATAPIYAKFYYGTGATTATPRMQIEFGTGTNGTGTLTGVLTTVTTITQASAPASTVTAYQSYLCVNNGAFWLIWKVVTPGGTGSPATGSFGIYRTADSAGAFDGASAVAEWYTSATNQAALTQILEFSPTPVARAATTSGSSYQIIVPGNNTTSVTSSGDNQLYTMWGTRGNQACPIPGTGAHFQSEVTEGVTFTSTPIGATTRTYISVGKQGGTQAIKNGAATGIAMARIWEG